MTQLLQNAVYGTALILVAAILRRVLKGSLLPEARLALWAVCLFRLLTPAAPESVLSLWGLLPRAGRAAPMPDPAPVPSMAAGGVPAVTAPVMPAEPAGAASPWGAALLAVWIGMGAVLAVRYVLNWRRTRRAVASAIPLGRDDPRHAPLPKCARLREGPMEGAPLTFGAVRPTVVLSPGLAGEELVCVLAHEGVHARRRDNLWHYAMALVQAVYWWDPAVWLMARLLRRDIELSCDRAAVKALGADKRAEYAQALLSMATQAEGPAFCQTFGRKAAEERIVSIMKYKKTTIAGVVLSLALVISVTVAFASSPKAPAGEQMASNQPSGLFDKPVLGEAATSDQDGAVTEYTVDLDVLKRDLDRHVAEGTMAQAEADQVWALAQKAAHGDTKMTWTFVGDSGLTLDGEHSVCYRDESGKLIPADTATVVSRFIFPAGEGGVRVFVDVDVLSAADTVTFDGRSYDRADLSAETLEWLDWYLALTEEEQLAVSYVPRDLLPEEVPETSDAPAMGEDLPTYVEPGQAAGELESEFYDYHFESADGVAAGGVVGEAVPQPGTVGETGYQEIDGYTEADGAGDYLCCGLPTAPTTDCRLDGCTETRLHCHQGDRCILMDQTCPVEGCTQVMAHKHNGRTYCFVHYVCPVEGCTITGEHIHDGVAYSCNGAGHSGGVCDGSCYAHSTPAYYERNGIDTTQGPFTTPVESRHGGGHHGNGHH